jgi:hypothetical protein
VNIQFCDTQATSNRNSYVPLRPRKNGRLGAEPDNSHLLRAAWGRRLFFFSSRLVELPHRIYRSANSLLEAYFAEACSCFSVRLSLLSLRPAAREVRKLETVDGARAADQGFGARVVTMRERLVLLLDTFRLTAG